MNKFRAVLLLLVVCLTASAQTGTGYAHPYSALINANSVGYCNNTGSVASATECTAAQLAALIQGQSSITGGTCTNQAVTAISTVGVPTCTTMANAYLSTMASNTIKGNNSGGSAVPSDLTATQVVGVLGTPIYSNVSTLTSASGTFTPTWTGMALVTICGSGGGGGGVGTGAAATASGGTTGECLQVYYAVTNGVGISYTVGAAGTGAAAGNNPGGAGNTSTFGTLTAAAGIGGLGSASGNAATVALSTINAARHTLTASSTLVPIQAALTNGNIGGAGVGGIGGTPLAQIGIGGAGGNSATGGNATGFAAGGGGGGDAASNSFGGGNGSAGVIIVSY